MVLTAERLLWLRASRSTMNSIELSAASAVCMSSTWQRILAAIREKKTRSIEPVKTYANVNDGMMHVFARADHGLRLEPLDCAMSGSLPAARIAGLCELGALGPKNYGFPRAPHLSWSPLAPTPRRKRSMAAIAACADAFGGT